MLSTTSKKNTHTKNYFKTGLAVDLPIVFTLLPHGGATSVDRNVSLLGTQLLFMGIGTLFWGLW